MSGIFKTTIETNTAGSPSRRSASRWLWRPWYAKLWWAAIPVWWLGMAFASRVPALENIYDSAFGGFLNILFFPMTALMVLGVGYVRHHLNGFAASGKGSVIADQSLEDEHERDFDELNSAFDIYNPKSGGLYIGNPLSFQHPDRT